MGLCGYVTLDGLMLDRWTLDGLDNYKVVVRIIVLGRRWFGGWVEAHSWRYLYA